MKWRFFAEFHNVDLRGAEFEECDFAQGDFSDAGLVAEAAARRAAERVTRALLEDDELLLIDEG